MLRNIAQKPSASQLDDALHDPPRRPLELDALVLLIERDDELSSALADLFGSQARGRLCARAAVMQSRERAVVAEPEWREGRVGRSGLRSEKDNVVSLYRSEDAP